MGAEGAVLDVDLRHVTERSSRLGHQGVCAETTGLGVEVGLDLKVFCITFLWLSETNSRNPQSSAHALYSRTPLLLFLTLCVNADED